MSEVGEVVPIKTVTRSDVQVDLARAAESDTLPLHFLRVPAVDTVFLSSKVNTFSFKQAEKKNGRSRLYTAKKVPQKSIESNASCMIERPGCPEPRARAVVIQLVYYMKPSLEQHAILELWPRWLDYRRLEYPGGRGAGWVMSKVGVIRLYC